MAASGTVAVLLPGAFYFLRDTRVPPVALLRAHGVPLALSTHDAWTSVANAPAPVVTTLMLSLVDVRRSISPPSR